MLIDNFIEQRVVPGGIELLVASDSVGPSTRFTAKIKTLDPILELARFRDFHGTRTSFLWTDDRIPVEGMDERFGCLHGFAHELCVLMPSWRLSGLEN